MSFLRTLQSAIFTGDRDWAWRRRIVIVTVAACLAGLARCTYWPMDAVTVALVLGTYKEILVLVIGLYVGGAIADAHLKRKTDAEPPKP